MPDDGHVVTASLRAETEYACYSTHFRASPKPNRSSSSLRRNTQCANKPEMSFSNATAVRVNNPRSLRPPPAATGISNIKNRANLAELCHLSERFEMRPHHKGVADGDHHHEG